MNNIISLNDLNFNRIRKKKQRYRAMVKMESNTSYFTPEEMRKRDPQLYTDLVDVNMTDEERSERDRNNVDNMAARERSLDLFY